MKLVLSCHWLIAFFHWEGRPTGWWGIGDDGGKFDEEKELLLQEAQTRHGRVGFDARVGF